MGRKGRGRAYGALLFPCPFHLPFDGYCGVAQAGRYFASSFQEPTRKLRSFSVSVKDTSASESRIYFIVFYVSYFMAASLSRHPEECINLHQRSLKYSGYCLFCIRSFANTAYIYFRKSNIVQINCRLGLPYCSKGPEISSTHKVKDRA
jgi:hypothetical protein